MTIMRNAIYCNVCMTTIESFSVHDFKGCKCPWDSDTHVTVDGGHAYSHTGFGSRADFTVIEEEFVPEGPHTLEHSDVVLTGVHHKGQCWGEYCTIHNMSDHSKRSWVQSWNREKGRMERISPTSGRRYKDPDSP